MRRITLAVAPLVLVAAFAVVSCSDDRPVCAESGPPKPGGGSNARTSTSGRSSTFGRSLRSSTSRDRAGVTLPGSQRRSTVTRVKVTRVKVNNRTVVYQPPPQRRYDGYRWYPAYGAWYPPGVWPYGYAASYDCVLPADAVEDGDF